jgi:shikimate dehydrogenase
MRLKPDLILTLPAHPTPYAVVGSPINHSLSPGMQQAAFDHAAIEARYYRIEADDTALEKTVARLREVPFGGWNCTIPNKVRMYELCDRRAESAEQFRAVNTVVNENGVLIGHNTDGVGWNRALRDAFGKSPSELRILLLGTGGAGRALATQAILDRCPELIIANRDPGRAREVLDHLNAQFASGPLARTPQNLRSVRWFEPELAAALREVDLVLNATSAGLDPTAPPVLPARIIPANVLVFDTVYGAASERFRQEVAAAGAKWSDGLGMLLHQGAEAFRLWTGQDAPLDVMWQALTGENNAVRPAAKLV